MKLSSPQKSLLCHRLQPEPEFGFLKGQSCSNHNLQINLKHDIANSFSKQRLEHHIASVSRQIGAKKSE
jgi:hypothetical protein